MRNDTALPGVPAAPPVAPAPPAPRRGAERAVPG
ncbi:ABC transporter permease, partial [Kocuria rosea]